MTMKSSVGSGWRVPPQQVQVAGRASEGSWLGGSAEEGVCGSAFMGHTMNMKFVRVQLFLLVSAKANPRPLGGRGFVWPPSPCPSAYGKSPAMTIRVRIGGRNSCPAYQDQRLDCRTLPVANSSRRKSVQSRRFPGLVLERDKGRFPGALLLGRRLGLGRHLRLGAAGAGLLPHRDA